MSGLAVFAYGSLVSPASAAETLGRPVARTASARLEGWSRGWTLARDNARSEKTFARLDGERPSFCLGLDLRPDPEAAAPNGVLVEVSEAELRRLDLREIRYRRVEVAAAVRTPDPPRFDAVFAYRARPGHHRPVPPPGSIIVAAYARTVESAFAALGSGELELYRRTTAKPPVEIAEATLIEDAIPAGNPRQW